MHTCVWRAARRGVGELRKIAQNCAELRGAHHAARHVRVRPRRVRARRVARRAVEDAAAQDVVGGLLRVAPAAAARLEAVVRLPAAPLHVAEVDGATRHLALELAQHHLEAVVVDERVVVGLAVVCVPRLARRRGEPPLRRLLGDDADVRQPLARRLEHEEVVLVLRALVRQPLGRRAVQVATKIAAADHERLPRRAVEVRRPQPQVRAPRRVVRVRHDAEEDERVARSSRHRAASSKTLVPPLASHVRVTHPRRPPSPHLLISNFFSGCVHATKAEQLPAPAHTQLSAHLRAQRPPKCLHSPPLTRIALARADAREAPEELERRRHG